MPVEELSQNLIHQRGNRTLLLLRQPVDRLANLVIQAHELNVHAITRPTLALPGFDCTIMTRPWKSSLVSLGWRRASRAPQKAPVQIAGPTVRAARPKCVAAASRWRSLVQISRSPDSSAQTKCMACPALRNSDCGADRTRDAMRSRRLRVTGIRRQIPLSRCSSNASRSSWIWDGLRLPSRTWRCSTQDTSAIAHSDDTSVSAARMRSRTARESASFT